MITFDEIVLVVADVMCELCDNTEQSEYHDFESQAADELRKLGWHIGEYTTLCPDHAVSIHAMPLLQIEKAIYGDSK